MSFICSLQEPNRRVCDETRIGVMISYDNVVGK